MLFRLPPARNSEIIVSTVKAMLCRDPCADPFQMIATYWRSPLNGLGSQRMTKRPPTEAASPCHTDFLIALCRAETVSQHLASRVTAFARNAHNERSKDRSFTIPDPAGDGIEFIEIQFAIIALVQSFRCLSVRTIPQSEQSSALITKDGSRQEIADTPRFAAPPEDAHPARGSRYWLHFD